ncbi:unnamed protein product, partial [marine sediment metagenome]
DCQFATVLDKFYTSFNFGFHTTWSKVPLCDVTLSFHVVHLINWSFIFLQPIDDGSSDYYVEVVGSNGVSQNVTLAEMMIMDSVSGNSSYENTYGNVRGVGVYMGVKISDLVNLVGGMDEGYVVRIVAEDGYSQTFERFKVYPNLT